MKTFHGQGTAPEKQMMSDIQRYKQKMNKIDAVMTGAYPKPSKIGDWVKYKDHIKAMEAQKNRVSYLLKQLDKFDLSWLTPVAQAAIKEIKEEVKA